MRLLFTLLVASAVVGGCATTPQPAPATQPAKAPSPGMEKLLGQPVDVALALLGAASLDRREGTARHLQFAGACVLDIFYLGRDGQQQIAAHAEARLPSGQDVQPGECLSALLRGRGPG